MLPSHMVSFQIPTLNLFGLKNIFSWLILRDQELF